MNQSTSFAWPDINTLGWIRLAQFSGDLATRIEDTDAERVLLAAPFGPHQEPLATPELGTEFFVSWAIDRAVLEVPVALVSASEDHIPIWVCASIGEPTEIQRRNYVRVATGFSVKLDLFEGSSAVHGEAIDLSEGGLRVSVDRWAIDPGLRRFSVQIPLPEGKIDVVAQVVWWGNLDADGRRTVGMRFVDLEAKIADTIRRQVFAMQLDQRRRRAG